MITRETITSKQRSKLKSIAATLSPVTQIGKGGITDNLLKTLSDALDAHEIIKVNILETADLDARNLAENVAELLESKWPNVFTTNIKKSSRKGKIFVDYLRNNLNST